MKVIMNRHEPIAPPPPTVDIIGMSYEDAKALSVILACVAGSPSGPRGAADRLQAGFYGIGISWMDAEPSYQAGGAVVIEKR